MVEGRAGVVVGELKARSSSCSLCCFGLLVDATDGLANGRDAPTLCLRGRRCSSLILRAQGFLLSSGSNHIVSLVAFRRMSMQDRISIDAKICHGQACVKGTRIPVAQILAMLANGDSIDSLVDAYPSIERDDVLACLEYVSLLAEEQVTPIQELAAPSL